MGKRRTEIEHKDPRTMGSSDDEEEEVIVQEELTREQQDSIKMRKKLVPKRRGGNLMGSSIESPFMLNKSPFAQATEKPEQPAGVFSGFKGFTGFKPLVPSATTNSSITIETVKPTSLTNGITAKLSTPGLDTNGTAKPAFSLFSGQTTQSASSTTATSSTLNGMDDDRAAKNNSPTKNMNEMELKFINGLNELYEKCYGSLTKRNYKLPSEAFAADSAETDPEVKYASLLAELNKHCSKWISKHVEESPYVILTPVFVDYFNYLILLEKQFYPGTFDKVQTSSSSITITSTSSSSSTTQPSNNNGNNTNKPVNGEMEHVNGHHKQAQSAMSSSVEKENLKTTTTLSNQEPEKKISLMFNQQTPLVPISLTNSFDLAKKPVEASANSAASEFKFGSATTPALSFLNSSSKPAETLPTATAMTTPMFKFGKGEANKPAAETNTSDAPAKPPLFSFSTASNNNSSTSLGSTPASNETAPKPMEFKFGSSNTNTAAATTTTATSNASLASRLTFPTANSTNNNHSLTFVSPFSISSDQQKQTAQAPQSTESTNQSKEVKKDSSLLGVNATPTTTSEETANNTNKSTENTPFSFFSLMNKDKLNASTASPSSFGSKPTSESSNEEKKSSTESTTTTTTNQASIFKSFGFGATSTSATPFSFGNAINAGKETTTPGASLLGATPSFGTSTPFGGFGAKHDIFGSGGTLFGSTSNQLATPNTESTEADDDKEEYQPPKPESSDVKEEGAVFTKRTKLFYFNDKEKKFADKGIGNLFIKPTKDGGYLLIIRADNKLANILLNVKLNKIFPVVKETEKDVSYVCLPNPPMANVDSNTPCKFLFKVKTPDDATELFDKLNEYRK